MYSLHIELLVSQLDVFRTKIVLDTFISVTSNSGWRQYYCTYIERQLIVWHYSASYLPCPPFSPNYQIYIYSYQNVNKANATAQVEVCIPLVSTFCLVTLYLIDSYLIIYHHSAYELHYPLFLPILLDLYLLFKKCRIKATLMKKFLWGIS